MIRTIIWFIYFWFQLILSIPKLMKVKKMEAEALEKYASNISKKWAKKLLRLAGAKIEVRGIDNIPADDKGILYVANHQSNFDIPLLLGYLPNFHSFIAKIELKNFPIIGTWMEHLNCVFMDRENVRQSVRAISKGIKHLKRGNSMAIFPEGTRSLDGQLNEFKPGALKLGTKSKAHIVPVSINGTYDLMKKGSRIITPAKVEIVISKPIQNTEEKDTHTIADEVKEIIKKNIK